MSETAGRPVKGERLPEVSRTVTQDLMNDYTFTLGIANPIHHDPEFAARTEFGGPIASGPIALALIDDVLAAAHPAHWLHGGTIKVAFLRPVRPGDTVTAHLVVSEVEPKAGHDTVHVDIDVVNQDFTIVLAGSATFRV